jgi:8-amino-3,8-dideoxy-alpha-D-manno-octulosonate transaminase
MPGYELMGKEEFAEIATVFGKGGGVLFRHGFDQIRNGSFKVRDFEQAFAAAMGTPYALAVTSGTAALKVALEALQVGRGAEVITQAFTFVATVEAIVECGAIAKVVDIDETLNMDPAALERAITPATKAIIAVHMLGVPADMDRILAIARPRGIAVIEDTAWGCGGEYRGKRLGTIGDLGTYSFDYAKAITTGEGGMIVTRTKDLDFRARCYQDHGHENNPDVPRWEDTRHASGFNYRMTELQGAVGLAQLRKLDGIIRGQRETKRKLEECLKGLPGLTLRPCPEGGRESADALVVSTPSPQAALACRRELRQAGLSTKILPEAVTWHFAKTWTHVKQLVAADGGPVSSQLARSEALLARCVALPINLQMAEDVPGKIRAAIAQALK